MAKFVGKYRKNNDYDEYDYEFEPRRKKNKPFKRDKPFHYDKEDLYYDDSISKDRRKTKQMY